MRWISKYLGMILTGLASLALAWLATHFLLLANAYCESLNINTAYCDRPIIRWQVFLWAGIFIGFVLRVRWWWFAILPAAGGLVLITGAHVADLERYQDAFTFGLVAPLQLFLGLLVGALLQSLWARYGAIIDRLVKRVIVAFGDKFRRSK